jgi:hypothetical protein
MVATLKTTIIQEPSSASTNIQLDASGNTYLVPVSGQVGIGTTAPTRLLTLSGSGTSTRVQINNTVSGKNFGLYAADTGDSTINYGTASSLLFTQSGSETMRIDSSGNVGIGTTSPGYKLEVYAASNSLQIESVVHNLNTGTGVAAIGFNTSGSGETSSTKAGIGLVRGFAFGGGALAFYNNNSGAAGDFTTADEKMRIDSSGNLLVGTTGVAGRISVNYAGLTSVGIGFVDTSTTGTTQAATFVKNSSQVGSITTSNTATAYNTSSDYRLKENVAPMTTGLEKISALKPVTYDWISDKTEGEGFIAHELQAIIPHAVTGVKDAVDDEGNPVYQGVDYSKIVVHLVAAIQEQQATITSLTARIAKLEAK